MLSIPFHHPLLQNVGSEARRLSSHVTLKVQALLAGLFAILAAGVAMAAFASAVPACASGENLLVYSRYDSKGLVTRHAYRCGQPHRTCSARDVPLGNAPTYDCSAFVLPKGVVSW